MKTESDIPLTEIIQEHASLLSAGMDLQLDNLASTDTQVSREINSKMNFGQLIKDKVNPNSLVSSLEKRRLECLEAYEVIHLYKQLSAYITMPYSLLPVTPGDSR